ncbi:Cathepsin L [Araneus ventricosus]|uniref:Cathepsin L n=1 Tax=Araneus ventricosus TaxID=182803 RepID=A0A4Y2G2U4_ARAVE|nr:Cathepsin L [Araneus ventricosus]
MKEFINAQAKARKVCESMPMKRSFTVKRLRKVKRMAEDEAHSICAEKSFELKCFKVYDRLISEIKSRSDIYHTISSDFSFLSKKAFNESSVSYLEKCSADFGAKYNRDIDTLELVNEIATFKFQVKELVKNINTASHLDILKVISKYGLRNANPNIEIALRILMTMPVSVTSCERSFSKLKIIRNYLWSSMGESRLSNLAIMSTEYEKASKLDFNEKIYSKGYPDDEEDQRRRLWESKLLEYLIHNLKADLGLATYRRGLNAYSDYGQCGACWAFSAIGSLEGQHKKKSGHLVSLSEQQLVDCATNGVNNGCDGGIMSAAFEHIKNSDGVDTEKSYPYREEQGECGVKPENVAATCTGYIELPPGDESALKDAVATVGPISVAIDAGHDSFMSYKSGVYEEPDCSSTHFDHAVLVVGYGKEDGLDYWLIKNSWGESWGMNGYMKMARNKNNMCGIANKASYPLV